MILKFLGKNLFHFIKLFFYVIFYKKYLNIIKIFIFLIFINKVLIIILKSKPIFNIFILT